jgi:hypothetical protein
MGQTDLLDRLRLRPFRPFRIHVSDGTSYDIPHPDQASPSLTAVKVFIPVSDPTSPLWDEFLTISMWHVVRLEPIAAPGPSSN